MRVVVRQRHQGGRQDHRPLQQPQNQGAKAAGALRVIKRALQHCFAPYSTFAPYFDQLDAYPVMYGVSPAPRSLCPIYSSVSDSPVPAVSPCAILLLVSLRRRQGALSQSGRAWMRSRPRSLHRQSSSYTSGTPLLSAMGPMSPCTQRATAPRLRCRERARIRMHWRSVAAAAPAARTQMRAALGRGRPAAVAWIIPSYE